MLAPLPERKDKTPYIGQGVLDGTSSFYDWIPGKFVPISDLPRSLNPEKGYLVIANSRQAPDTSKYDYGSTIMSTAR